MLRSLGGYWEKLLSVEKGNGIQKVRPISNISERLPLDLKESDILRIRNSVIRELRKFGQSKRLTLYSAIAKELSRSNQDEKPLDQLEATHIRLSKKEKKIKNSLKEKISSLIFISPKICRETIWSIYENILNNDRAKKLGQYFTPKHVAEFTLSGLKNQPRSILDPMAGHGIFLRTAEQFYPSSEITGVEIDPIPILTSKLVLNKGTNVHNEDVFVWAEQNVQNDPQFEFSAIVGNPAYVSYQRLREIGKFSAEKNDENRIDYGKFLLEKLKSIAEIKNKSVELSEVFQNWSGYSDLSTYTLILAWLLAKEKGQIAFVLTNHWMERNYGLQIRRFLVKHGTVHGILTHRGGNWFPQAQIPTSVIVYSKGAISHQRDRVPYVNIRNSSVDNLQLWLEEYLDEEFWTWIESIEKPGNYGSLHVSFLNWSRSLAGQPKKINHLLESNQLHLPAYLKNISLSSLSQIGWEAHQGLRTGCNEIFYVHKNENRKRDDQFIACLTQKGKKIETPLNIPADIVRPAITKQTHQNRLILNKKHADAYLLDLRNSILPSDISIINRYPEEWLIEWKVDKLKIIPEPLATYLSKCAEMRYEKSNKRTKVRDLSAVRTNISIPERGDFDHVPSPPKFWYQLPLQARHFGKIIIPRISAKALRAYLIEEPDIVIDANFVTFTTQSNSLSTEKLWVWLNSNTFRLLCEINGARLGGGALKLEATLLSKALVPKNLLGKIEKEDISYFKTKVKDHISNKNIIELGKKIDKILFNDRISKRNANALIRFIEQRRRKA